MTGGKDRQEFSKLFSGRATSGGNGTVTATTRAQHIIKVAETGVHTKHGALDIHLGHWSVVNGLSLATKPGADVTWICHQSPSDATAFLVDPPHFALWALDGVNAGSTRADSTGLLVLFLENIEAKL